MIDLAVLKGSSVRRAGAGALRPGDGARPAWRRDRCVAWDDNERSAQGRRRCRRRVWPIPRAIDWSKVDGAGDQPRHPQPPAQAASRGCGGARRRHAADLRRRAAGPCPARRALRRHHRHQRQVDHHGADRPYPEDAGAACEVGGNIGRGALDLAPLGADGIYVLELSSYQLELLETFRAHVAVWLNITPDHIDRHGDMAGYVAAKEHIFDRQQRRRLRRDRRRRRIFARGVRARSRSSPGHASASCRWCSTGRSPAASRSAPAC